MDEDTSALLEEEQEIAGISETLDNPDIKPTLAGLGPDYTVEVFNPLRIPFRAKFARSSIGSPNLSEEQRNHIRKMADYGIKLSKDSPIDHVPTYLVMQPGQTLKLPGEVAQVVVNQLVNTILQRTGQVRSLADSSARNAVEKEIIQNYDSIVQSVESGTPQDNFDRQIAELNNPKGAKEVKARAEEKPFPDLTKQLQQLAQYIETEQSSLEKLQIQQRSLKNQIKSLQSQKAKQIDDIYLEAETLKSKLKNDIDTTRDVFTLELEGFEQRTAVAKEETKRVEAAFKLAHKKFVTQADALMELESNISARVLEHDDVIDDITEREAYLKDLETAVEAKRLALIEAEKSEKDLSVIENKAQTARAELKALLEQQELERAQAQLDLDAIHNDLQKAIDQLKEVRNQEELIREDLAGRAKALEKREEVVKKREYLAQSAKLQYQKTNDFLKL